jgi:hypothetical protein
MKKTYFYWVYAALVLVGGFTALSQGWNSTPSPAPLQTQAAVTVDASGEKVVVLPCCAGRHAKH